MHSPEGTEEYQSRILEYYDDLLDKLLSYSKQDK
jgi:hypothetical protein